MVNSFPWYKRILSYLYDVLLEKVETHYNGVVDVHLSNGRVKLSTEKAVYSYQDLYTVYSKGLNRINLDWSTVNDILILGFGMGSIPEIISSISSKPINYVGVDIEEEFFVLFKEYIGIPQKSNMEFVTADAGAFVKTDSRQYDLLFVDLFIDNLTPQKFRTEDFALALKERLTEKGIVLLNFLVADNLMKRDFEEYFEKVFSKIFPDAMAVLVEGNQLLLSRRV